MILTAYAQASQPKMIRLWVGIFAAEQPPALKFFIDSRQAVPLDPPLISPIRDRQIGANGSPVNHQGIFRFNMPDAGLPHLVRVEAGTEHYQFMTNTLPERVPERMAGSFNLLLCSCYYQPEDAAGLLGTIVGSIKVQPHLTVMAGDQVYLDLPLLEDLPKVEPELSHILGGKYLRNWASGALGIPGLEDVLARAPVVCIPDDHEFWNNYPFKQKQLPNTWDPAVRKRWADAAQALYEDYQIGGVPGAGGTIRIDVEPLKMLFVDMRCRRDDAFGRLMDPAAAAALAQWTDDLLAAQALNKPAIGVLGSGQALFIDPPQEEFKKINVDAEMGNYAEFDLVKEKLDKLADKGIPVAYLTGDVHWSRVASGVDQISNRTLLYEVISSPSRLIRTPFIDAAKESTSAITGIFGKQNPWPRHGKPAPVPDRFGVNRRFRLESKFGRAGDRVAILSFTQSGSGVDMQVRYYAIHTDKSISQSEVAGPYSLSTI